MNNHKTLVIIGAGGHGSVVADCAESTKRYHDILFLDDSVDELKYNNKWPITAKVDNWRNYQNNADFIVAIGDNKTRKKIHNMLKAAGVALTSLIHPTASVSRNADIKAGVVILANAVVNIGAVIEEGCIINTAATIEHDCYLDRFCHISPGANLAGAVQVGQLSWLGIGSAVVEGVTISPNTQTGAGAVLTTKTKPDTLYLGVPAKPFRPLKKVID